MAEPLVTRRTRVLHVVQNLNYGGMEQLIAQMVRHADHERFELHVLALQYLGRFSAGLDTLATLHVAPRMRSWSLLYPRELAQLIRRLQPDVVHTHSGVWLKAARAARLANVPFSVHTEHGRRFPDPMADKLLDGFAARSSDRVVAVSAKLRDHLIDALGIPAAKVMVITNGVEILPTGDRTAQRRALDLSPEAVVIGSVGRLEPIKGYEFALRALSLLQRKNVVLVIAGDGSQREMLEVLAGQLGVREQVRLLGWRDDVTDLHAAADIFTLASRSEGTSVSLLEAMAAGLCPVVTDVGGNRDVLGPALSHRLVQPQDPEALAEGWRRAIDESVQRQQDGAAARRRVEAAFSIRRMVSEYEALYAGTSADRATLASQAVVL